jgi:ATP-binding cassette, subfamily B, multidrug efflux pump
VSPSLVRALTFVRRYRRLAALAVLAVLLASAADLVSPQLLRQLIDVGIQQQDFGVILRDSVLLVGVAIFGGLASFAQGYLSARVSHGAAFEMRNVIFDKLQDLSFSWHDQAQTGQLITRVTSDVDLVRDFVGGGLVQVISAVLLLVGAVVVLLMMNVTLALVSFLVVPATVTVLLLFVRKLGPMFRENQQRLGALNTVLQENVSGVRVVRAFARERFEEQRYDIANRSLLEQGLVVRRTVANAFPLLFSVGSIGVAVVSVVGAALIVKGTMQVGELVAFTSYLFLLLGPLFTLGFGAQSIAQAGASADRLFEILDAPNDVAERPDAAVLPTITGRVEFECVSLRYPGADHETLSGITLAIEPETTVAIVGATGSGKTSLVNLVPRFYDATEGTVCIDGTDVRDVTLSSLRSQIGIVMQESVLFSGSVRENIAYGRPDADLNDVIAASRAAQADGFVRNLPGGYDTRVGERGVKLSGGQRQRIAIARALLIDPRVLIMDDATSSVDSATEAALRAQLDGLMEGRTTLVIAQRLSTARRADLVVVMEDGRVVATGTHEQLLETNCLYAEIAASQLVGGESIDASAACELDEEADA